MPYIDVAGGTLFYAVSRGSKESPVVLLVHGAGGTRLHWPAELRRLPGATVLTLDLPGHGRSAGPGCDMIGGYAERVDAFVRAVGIERTVVVGHSMGGAIAQTLALKLAGPSMSSCDAWLGGLVLVATGARLRVAPAILDGIRSDFEEAAEVITRLAWSSDAPRPLTELGRKALLDTGPAVVLGDFTACDRFDVIGRLEGIEVPVLVIAGTADQLTPVKYARFLCQSISDARCVTVEGAGHMVMLERPQEVAEAVEEFLARQR